MIKLFIIPLISALIGYVTNVVAIRMVFRPREPINILGYKLQGLLPRRQMEIAIKIGEVVERELLSVADLMDRINTPDIQARIVKIISESVRDKLEESMPRFIPQTVTRTIGDLLEGILQKEAKNLVVQVIESGRQELEHNIKVHSIVEDKIMNLELVQMEQLTREVAARELRHIEVLGGVLGFAIGLVQVAIILIFP